MKLPTPQEVLDAYKATGLTPAPFSAFMQTEETTHACALGAVAAAALLERGEEVTKDSVFEFLADSLDSWAVRHFMDGFDDTMGRSGLYRFSPLTPEYKMGCEAALAVMGSSEQS